MRHLITLAVVRKEMRGNGRLAAVQIIMKDSITRKKLFFLPHSGYDDRAFAPDIELNGRSAVQTSPLQEAPLLIHIRL